MWVLTAHDFQDLQATPARHLFVQQNEVVGVLPYQDKRVVPIRDRVHVITTRLQKEKVRLEKVDLVVDPEDSFSRRLHGQGLHTDRIGNQEPTALPPLLAGSNTHSAASLTMRALKSCRTWGGTKLSRVRYDPSSLVHEDPDLDALSSDIPVGRRQDDSARRGGYDAKTTLLGGPTVTAPIPLGQTRAINTWPVAQNG